MSENIEDQLDKTFEQMSDVTDKELNLGNEEIKTEEIKTEEVEEHADFVEVEDLSGELSDVEVETEEVETEEVETEEVETEEVETQEVDEDKVLSEMKKIIKENNNFNYISEGKVLVAGLTKDSITKFCKLFSVSGSLSNPSHYKLLELFKKLK